MTRWEYAVRATLERSELNSMGGEGWEAVGLTQECTTTWVLFKRPLPPADTETTDG